jgi:hypothetical protein
MIKFRTSIKLKGKTLGETVLDDRKEGDIDVLFRYKRYCGILLS